MKHLLTPIVSCVIIGTTQFCAMAQRQFGLKKLVLSLAFVLMSSTYVIANNSDNSPAIISKFEIASCEVLGLDEGSYSKYGFKKNDCETGGYSFFSPFYLNPSLAYAKIDSERLEDKVNITVKYEEEKHSFSVEDIKISENGTIAEFNIVKDNVVYPSKLYGSNLSTENILETFSNFDNTPVISEEACPPCIFAIIVVVADTIADICKNAQEQCSDCNGKLTVTACGCTCEEKPKAE